MKTFLAFMVFCIFANSSAKYILSKHQVDLNTSPKEKTGIITLQGQKVILVQSKEFSF